MANFEIATRLDRPPSAVWEFVSWQGMGRLVAGGFFERVDYPEGAMLTPGATRRFTLADGSAVKERLERLSDHDLAYDYAIVDGGNYPVSDYRGRVAVTPAGAGCTLKFGHVATLIDIDEESWRQTWTNTMRAMFEFIRTHA